MPCHAAMIDKFTTISPEDSVEDTLKLLKKNKTDIAIVTDENDKFLGTFKIRTLFQSLLPVSVMMEGAGQGDLQMSAAPGIAKRLKKIEPLCVEQFMDINVPVTAPESPIWVGVKLLVDTAEPVVVVDEASAQAIGIIDMPSMMAELVRLKKS